LRRESLPFTQRVRLPLAKLRSVSEMRIALVFLSGIASVSQAQNGRPLHRTNSLARFCLSGNLLDSYSVAAIRSLSFDSLCAETAQIIVTSQSQVSS